MLTPCALDCATGLTGVKTVKTFIKTFLRDEAGASAAEYALILAIVGVAIGAAALTLGNNVKLAIGNASKDVFDCSNPTNTTTGTVLATAC